MGDKIIIKLIQPKMPLRPMDTSLKTRMAPSLGLLVIAQILRKEHTVIIEDENISPVDYSGKADIVGISVTVNTVDRAAEISRKFQKTGAVTIGGGIHISADPDRCEKYFDAICVGPSETVWDEIINDFQVGKFQHA